MAWLYRLRGGTAAEGAAVNPVLREREPGVEYDTGHMKIGDGVTAYVDLPYVHEPTVTAAMSYPLTVQPGDGLILADGDITLPAATRPGETHIVKALVDGVTVSSVDLIDGQESVTLDAWEALTVIATGADWVIV